MGLSKTGRLAILVLFIFTMGFISNPATIAYVPPLHTSSFAASEYTGPPIEGEVGVFPTGLQLLYQSGWMNSTPSSYREFYVLGQMTTPISDSVFVIKRNQSNVVEYLYVMVIDWFYVDALGHYVTSWDWFPIWFDVGRFVSSATIEIVNNSVFTVYGRMDHLVHDSVYRCWELIRTFNNGREDILEFLYYEANTGILIENRWMVLGSHPLSTSNFSISLSSSNIDWETGLILTPSTTSSQTSSSLAFLDATLIVVIWGEVILLILIVVGSRRHRNQSH